MKCVAIGDMHRDYEKLIIPEADVLIVAGDIECYEFAFELDRFNSWLKTVPCKNKVIIAGNHDGYLFYAKQKRVKEQLTNGIYLENEGVEIDGIRFWGSPNTPVFYDWYFMLPSHFLKETWEKIPKDTNILITHGPPYGILDYVEIGKRNVGCPFLRDKVQEITPQVHVFGHIHSNYGVKKEISIKANSFKKETVYINCSLMDEDYIITNTPITFYIYKKDKDFEVII